MSNILRLTSGLVSIGIGAILLYPYPLLVYLTAAAVLAATKQPIAIAAFVTWWFCLSKESLSNDQESEWNTELHAVIVGSTLFYTGWCTLPEGITNRIRQ